jgi:cell division protein FtsQ
MAKNSKRNELIKKRRKKKAIKRCIIFFVLLLSILITLCLKLSYFNITAITVLNNKNVSKEEIIKLSDINKGTNIFYQNFNKSKKSILSNPYILDVSFSRKIPNKIEISVDERKAEFYCQIDSKFFIIDKDAIVLEIRNDINNMKLTKIDGIDIKPIEVGKNIGSKDDKKVKTIRTFADLIQRTKTGVPEISSIDFTDSKNLKVNYGNMCVILGTWYNIESKLNKAIDILESDQVKSAKGYIDVSFNGMPVISIQR